MKISQNRTNNDLVTLLAVIVVVFMVQRLDFAALSVACTLKDVESLVFDQMAVLVHVAYRPITELAVVDDRSADLGAIAEGKRAAGEGLGFDALNLTLADRANG